MYMYVFFVSVCFMSHMHYIGHMAKASKGMHQVCFEKSPDRYYPYIYTKNSSTGCTSIHCGFIKCFDIAVFCFILNQFGLL